MAKVIENNYVPKIRTITHTGYRTVCPSCNSVFVLEYSDIKHDMHGIAEYCCPCCHLMQGFKKDKRIRKHGKLKKR